MKSLIILLISFVLLSNIAFGEDAGVGFGASVSVTYTNNSNINNSNASNTSITTISPATTNENKSSLVSFGFGDKLEVIKTNATMENTTTSLETTETTTEETIIETENKNTNWTKIIIYSLISIFVIGIIAVAWYFYNVYYV